MASRKSVLQGLLERVQAELVKEFETTQAIERKGDKLILPSHMDYNSAIEVLARQERLMEEQASVQWHFDANPNDALVAFYNSVREQFGNLMGSSVETWFGVKPARSINVPIDFGVTVNVPIGKAEIPGLPMSFDIRPNFDDKDADGGDLNVFVNFKRMYQPLVDRIKEQIDNHLKNHSIYRGKAIDSKWNFLDVKGFDVSRVVYSANVRKHIDADILTVIRKTEEWKKSGSAVKRGILLHGIYGTGKTLTALMVAKTCVDNGWTFVSVLPHDDIVKAINFAKRYQPAVVNFEDIDAEVSGAERTQRLNEILNTLDGLLTKETEVMAILTTNHVEKLHKGMLRPGRLDAVIQLSELDAEGVLELVKVASRNAEKVSLLNGDELDKDALYRAAEGMAPAYIVEAVTKAKSYAMARDNGNGIQIVQQDIVDALEGLRPQWVLMQAQQVVEQPDLEKVLGELVSKQINGSLHDQVERLQEVMDNLQRAIDNNF